MRNVTVGICFGALAAHVLPLEAFTWWHQQPVQVFPLTALALLPVGYAAIRHELRLLSMVLGVLVGSAWSIRAIETALTHRLPLADDRVEVELEGDVAGLPRFRDDRLRIQLKLSKVTAIDGRALPALRNVTLTLYVNATNPTRPLAGERWRVRARLRAPHGYQNPGGFDYEAWLLGQGIDATGYVLWSTRLSPADDLPLWQQGQHARLSLRNLFLAGHADQWGALLALVTADTQLMNPAQWQVFRHTGTVHLMVISGLHVGLVAALSFFPGRWVVVIFPGLGRRLPYCRWGMLTSLLGVLAYVALAGFSIPTQRAALMIGVVLWAQWLGRSVPVSTLFLYALCLVVLVDPLAPLATGFWLSFGAVAVLLLGIVPKKSIDPSAGHRHFAQHRSLNRLTHKEGSILEPLAIFRERCNHWVAVLIRVQLLLFVGMLPLMWFSIGRVQWVAPIANLVAVPLVTLLIVPLALSGSVLLTIWPGIGGRVLDAGGWLMGMLSAGLGNMAHLSEALFLQSHLDSLSALGVAVLTASSALYLLPGPPWRLLPVVLTLCWLVALTVFPSPVQRPLAGEVQITVLDVGQGTAVLIDTAQHRLLYDAGNRYPSGFDLGAAVVVPAIRASGPGRLHSLVLSHDDRDHIGGAEAVLTGVPVKSILRGEFTRALVGSGAMDIPDRQAAENSAGPTAVFCGEVEPWVWDQVQFEILHPRDRTRTGNDSSCVVSIQSRNRRILLTGDISTRVEQHLLPRLGKLDVLLVAHHGSNSSSGRAFIERTRPTIALVSSGFGNRFDHPNSQVVAQFLECGTRLFNTAGSGALVWQSWNPIQVIEWRWRAGSVPYWRTGARLSMKDPGIRQKTNTSATRRNESRKACVMP